MACGSDEDQVRSPTSLQSETLCLHEPVNTPIQTLSVQYARLVHYKYCYSPVWLVQETVNITVVDIIHRSVQRVTMRHMDAASTVWYILVHFCTVRNPVRHNTGLPGD